MLNNIINTTKILINRIIDDRDTNKKINSTNENKINSLQEVASLKESNKVNKDSSSENHKNKNTVDKIYFQPNIIVASENIDCGITKKSIESELTEKIIIECSKKTLWQLDKICRYFEIEQSSAIMRGLWMLNVVQECEIANKKIGVITLDNNNVVVDVSPINIV